MRLTRTSTKGRAPALSVAAALAAIALAAATLWGGQAHATEVVTSGWGTASDGGAASAQVDGTARGWGVRGAASSAADRQKGSSGSDARSGSGASGSTGSGASDSVGSSGPSSTAGGTDGAGNVLLASTSGTVGIPGTSVGAVDRITDNSDGDLVWLGASGQISGSRVAGDVLAAGQSVEVSGVTAGGSVRVAGQNVAVKESEVGRNVTVAGMDVTVDAGTSARGVYLAGQNVTFQGTAQSLVIVGDVVTIGGTVNGDVSVSASTVTVAKNAHIGGKLDVSSPSQPQVESGSEIGELSVTTTDSSAAAEAAVIAAVSAVVSATVVAVVLALVLPGVTCGGARMMRTRPAQLLASGVLGTFAVLPVIIVLCLLVLPAELGLAALAATTSLALVCVPLTGAALCGALLPRWNRVGAAALGGLAWSVLGVVPYVGMGVTAFSFVFALGMALQAVWLGMRHWRGMRAGGQDATGTPRHGSPLPGTGSSEGGAPVPPSA